MTLSGEETSDALTARTNEFRLECRNPPGTVRLDHTPWALRYGEDNRWRRDAQPLHMVIFARVS